MNSPIQPLGARIVAKHEEVKKQTKSGLFLPDEAKEKPMSASVIAVGPDVKHLKVGDNILHKEYSATELKMDNENYLIVEEKDVLGTLNT